MFFLNNVLDFYKKEYIISVIKQFIYGGNYDMKICLQKTMMGKARFFIKHKLKLSNAQILVGGFVLIILVGTLLLMMPVSSRQMQPTSFLDALFTATSSACVTGLVVFDTYSYWSIFGQLVILALIQIGGLGFMTLGAIGAFVLRSKISFKQRLVMSESIGLDDTNGVVRMTSHILVGTFLFEAIGAVILSIRFIPEFGLLGGIYKGVFHAVSAFCNSGMDLIGEKAAFGSLTPYVDDWIINITIMLLIIIGGTGFYVWEDIYRSKSYKNLTLHSKLVLLMNIALIIFGAVMIFFLDYNNPKTLGALPFHSKLLASLFQSVTSRTAGFCTLNLADLSVGSTFVMMILMFIGGAPGSTAGGIKTTTLGLLFFTSLASIRGSHDINAFKRRMDVMAVYRAVTIVLMALCITVGGILILSAFDPGYSLKEIAFEVISAFGTVGVTLGITPSLGTVSKLTLIFIMFFGRVGVMTIMLSIAMKGIKAKNTVRYPVGRILI